MFTKDSYQAVPGDKTLQDHDTHFSPHSELDPGGAVARTKTWHLSSYSLIPIRSVFLFSLFLCLSSFLKI
jgi:hypothetical protein